MRRRLAMLCLFGAVLVLTASIWLPTTPVPDEAPPFPQDASLGILPKIMQLPRPGPVR